MNYLSLFIFALSASFSSVLFAENKLSLPDTEVRVRTHDGNDLSLYQYPASGDTLLVWIGGNGWRDRSIQLARDFKKRGIEVWQIDFAENLMQTPSSTFMRNLDAQYVADVIDAAHQRTGKRVVLFAHAFAAIPALSGATLWQQRKVHHGKLLGAILFSPDLVTGLPALGKDPEYLPITRVTNIPLMLYQGSLHGSSKEFSRLLNELNSHNPNVFYTILPGVTGVFHHSEASPATYALLKNLPQHMHALFNLFSTLTIPVTTTAYVAPAQTLSAGLDIQLQQFSGKPVPPTIDLKDANGKRYKRTDYRGKITVVNFWASWCAPCVAEIPSLNRLREQMQGLPFELISINYAESPVKIREFMQKVSVQFPVLIDPKGKVAQQWNVIAFPSTFVIGADGQIQYGVNAAIHWDTPEVVNSLKALVR
jgi:peroxiredoxin